MKRYGIDYRTGREAAHELLISEDNSVDDDVIERVLELFTRSDDWRSFMCGFLEEMLSD
jgi:hypothetical protein